MLGQALLTKRMGKSRVIAETGAGQHGVATATACALLDLECVVYMGEVDTERQALNVARMRLLGATVIPVKTGSRTLKDAINEALRDWVTNVDDTHYLLGTVAGPHPFPTMVRDFHRIIGLEAREQVLDRVGRLPDAVAACVGGGSNAIGIFHAFLDDPGVRLVGFEPGGDGVETGRHGATLTAGSPGALHGAMSYLLQDEDGQTSESYSISAGLDYPGVGPEHALLKDLGRAEYRPITDAAAMDAFALLCRTEGIIPAIESAHAVAGALQLGRELGPDGVVLVNLSGRGDKDVDTAAKWFGMIDRDESAEQASGTAIAEGADGRRAERGARAAPGRRGHRERAAMSGPGGRDRRHLRRLPGRGPGRAGRLPARRLPDRRRLGRAARPRSPRRLRPARGRGAVLGPGDGRPDHPGRGRDRAARRDPAARRDRRGRAGRPRPAAGRW